MELEIIETTALQIETNDGTWFIPDESDTSHDYVLQFTECRDVDDILDVSEVTGVFWRLSMPGYLDCTEWSFAEDLIGALIECMGMYGNDESTIKDVADNIPGFDEFWEGYIMALGFTSSDMETGENPFYPGPGEFSDYVTIDEILATVTEDEINGLRSDCVSFILDAFPMIENDMGHAGHDFHLARNRHGAGFCHGGWDSDDAEYGDKLAELSRPYGPAALMAENGEFMLTY